MLLLFAESQTNRNYCKKVYFCVIPNNGKQLISALLEHSISSLDSRIAERPIIGWRFCDIQNNQGWGKSYQQVTSTLIILDIKKTNLTTVLL